MWQILLLSLILSFSLIAESKKSDDEDELVAENYELNPEYEDDFEFSDGVSKQANAYGATTTLTSVYDPWGVFDVVRNERSISVLAGSETIASLYHASLLPQAHFTFWQVAGNVGVPLKFPLYYNGESRELGQRSRGFVPIKTGIKPRDFRTAWDISRVVRHVEVGAANTPYLARLSRSHAITLGNGELVKTLTPDYLYDVDQLFFSGHWSFDAARVEGFLGPVPKLEMFGVSLSFKPFQELLAPSFVRELGFGISYVNDFKAPNQAHTEDGAFVLTDDRRLVKRDTGLAQGVVVSADSEMFVTPWLSLRPYASFGQMWLSDVTGATVSTRESYGFGGHLGHDLAIYFYPNSTRSVLLAKVEGRMFSQGYWPGYFGSSYMIDRLSMHDRKNASPQNPLTKSQLLSTREAETYRVGYLGELGYSLENMFSIKAGYENAHSSIQGVQITPMRKINLITSIVGLEVIKFHLGYQVTSINQLNELFDFEQSRALLSFRGQVKLSPNLYFDAWAKHSFGINDMYASATMRAPDGEPMWLSNSAESKSLNFGLGLEFAMAF